MDSPEGIRVNVPVVYMARNVMVLRRATSLQGALVSKRSKHIS
jgi:hypothetical protein